MIRQLPDLRLADWRATRDTLHIYARILGKIRGAHGPKSKHWWHISLHVSARGLTTTPFPMAGQILELTLDLASHGLIIESGAGWRAWLPLGGQSAARLCRDIDAALAAGGAQLDSELLAAFDSDQTLAYDVAAVDRYRRVNNGLDMVLKTFKGGLREETSPVQIFPHHLDLAMSWFSGRLVPGADPADEESADEQMSFGFVTGDDSIPDAYFYVTAYPAPDGWTDMCPPAGAYWHTQGWTGAVLPYSRLAEASDPQALLLDYLRTLQVHGQRLMTPGKP